MLEFSLSSIENVYGLLQAKTEDVDLEVFRALIRTCSRIENKAKFDMELQVPDENDLTEPLKRLSEMLLIHMNNGLGTLEGQTLCATAYCALFIISSEESCLACLQTINSILMSYLITSKENKTTLASSDLKQRHTDMIPLSLICGIYQTNILNTKTWLKISQLKEISENISQVSFEIIVKACLTYSSSSFTSFRTFVSMLKKIYEWGNADKVIAKYQNVVLFVIFNNWESPVPGIRDSNVKLWEAFLNLITESKAISADLFNDILASIMKFPWNKAKYFTLSEIIPRLKCSMIDFLKIYPTCMKGLEYSLKNSSLVSAGGDMYKNFLQSMKSFEDWCDIFLQTVETILYDDNFTMQINLLNHWIPQTIKKYPSLFERLISTCHDESKNENSYYVTLSILKLGRKKGLILTDWNEINGKHKRFKRIIEIGLKDINEDVRSQAFQIVCITQKNNMPTAEEFDIVKEFLINNVNNDSTAFRQSNLNSFTLFLIRLRDSCLQALKDKKIKDDVAACKVKLQDLEEFFFWMYNFLVKNLREPGNYQRKILSLQMYDVISRYLCGRLSDNQNIQKRLCRKSNQLEQGSLVVAYLQKQCKWYFHDANSIQILSNCIYDPTNDIRETATNILIQYYSNNSALLLNRQDIFINGLTLCNSKLFYETESGCLMFKIIACIHKNDTDLQFILPLIEPSKNIPEYLIKKAWEQFACQENDLLFSIYNNQPLYGMISAVDTFIKNSPCELIQCDFIKMMIKFLMTVTDHFLATLALRGVSDYKDHPPSFAEMGESIENVITSSAFKLDSRKENMEHISNAHQIILNNIWLNLKACCELSTTIVIKYTNLLQESNIKDCLDVSLAVLTRCRHKGAIESAGVTLGRSVKHLTSLKNSVYQDLIANTLRDFLVQATSEDIHGGSITRKSAGLTILVHRMVTNDSQDGKPLFYLTMNLLLRVLKKSTDNEDDTYPDCNSKRNILDAVQTVPNVDDIIANERDVPMARALHLLCRTVCESSLAGYVIQFASQLATVCFEHLTSEQWQVRNAALQLYGALVPKLIGQKKSQADEVVPESPVSVDELFAHINSLWQHILSSLQDACNIHDPERKLINHSNLVPILSLLSGTAKRYNLNHLSVTECENMHIKIIDIQQLFPYLSQLLGSPIYTVRNISAKIVESFYDIKTFHEHWVERQQLKINENELHGYMLTLKYYVCYFNTSKSYNLSSIEIREIDKIIKSIMIDFNDLIEIMNSSYVVRAVHFEIKCMVHENKSSLNYFNSLMESIALFEKVKSKNNLMLGFHHWLSLQINFAVLNCSEDELISISEACLKNNDLSLKDDLLQSIKNRIKRKMLKNTDEIQKLFDIMVEFCCKDEALITKNTFYILYILASNTSLKLQMSNLLLLTHGNAFDILYSSLKLKDITEKHRYNQGYLLPLLCLLSCNEYITKTEYLTTILELSKICKSLSKPKYFEVEHRHTAALCSLHFKKLLTHFEINKVTLNEPVRNIICNTLSSLIWLLQDEDFNVRKESSKFHLNGELEKQHFHPTINLDYILSADYLSKAFGRSNELVTQFLMSISTELNQHNGNKINHDLQNPFDHNTSNIYWEPQLINSHTLFVMDTINTKSHNHSSS